MANNKISHIPDWETTQCEEQFQNFAQSPTTQPKLHATWELRTKLHNVPHWDATQCHKHCQNPALSPHGNLPFTIMLNMKRATYATKTTTRIPMQRPQAKSHKVEQSNKTLSRHENYISELRTANIRRKMLKYSHKNPHNEVWCPYEMTMRWNVNVNVAGSKYVTCVWCKV